MEELTINPNQEKIIQIICNYKKFKRHRLTLVNRGDKEFSKVKHLCFYFLREYTLLSLNQIGESVSFRAVDHTTCIAGINKIRGYFITDEETRNDINKIIELLKRARIVPISKSAVSYAEVLRFYEKEKSARKRLQRENETLKKELREAKDELHAEKFKRVTLLTAVS
jgi:hypothetical protein